MHPQHADELRHLLTTVAAVERLPARALAAGVPALARLGDYRIERQLGRGGMGIVYLATQESLGRRVALKFLPVQATLDPRFLERFRREARAAAQLSHPNIVPVFGVGEEQGLHYFAMQYVDGHPMDAILRTLRSWSDAGPSAPARDEGESSVSALARKVLASELSTEAPPPPFEGLVELDDRRAYHRNVARIGVCVGEALAYAHSHGILHRDVKPGNLLLDARGRVWVSDFGLCKTGDVELTATTDMVGTLRYMAPEQLQGRADVRSDVYGLGVTLYELLTLQPPFEDTGKAALIAQVSSSQPVRPRRIDARVPRDLEAIVLKSTAKLAEERYGTVEAMVEDLQAFLDGRPIAARPPSALHLLRLAIRRNRVLATTIAVASLFLLLASLLYLWKVQVARGAQERNLYLASIAAAASSIASHPDTAREGLESAPPRLRDWEWEHLRSRLDESLFTYPETSRRLDDLAITPDHRIVLAAGGQELVVRELDPPGREWVLHTDAWLNDVEVSPDGATAIGADGAHVRLWSLAGEPALVSARPAPLGGIDAVCFAPDGRRVYLGGRDGRIRCLDEGLEHELFVLPPGHPTWVRDLETTPDGRTLLSCGADGTIRIWDLETQGQRVLRGHEGFVRTVAVSVDGALLASGGEDGSVRLWELATGRPLAVWREHGDIVRRVLFSSDGRSLYSCADDRKIVVYDLALRAPVRSLQGHGFFVMGLVELGDGLLLTGGVEGSLKRWDPSAAGGRLSLTGHVADLWDVAFDATGRRLVSTSRDGTVRVWDAATGRQERVLVHATPESARFTADGGGILAGYKDGALRHWDVSRGELVWEFRPPPDEARGPTLVTVDPTGERFFAVVNRRGLEVWERAEDGWRRTRTVALPDAMANALAPDGRRLAVATQTSGELVVLDTGTWERVLEVGALPAGRIRLAFAPDGRTLAAGCCDGVVRLWSLPDGALVRAIQVEPGGDRAQSEIWGVAFAPSGTRLACATSALGVSLWDPARGDLVVTLEGPGRGYSCLDFGAGGSLASPSWDGRIRVWDTLSAAERRERLDALAPDPLAERQAADGSFAGLRARTMELLRADERSPEDAVQAYLLARGLYKEHYQDHRALEPLGEAAYRLGRLEEARSMLRSAVDASEQADEPSLDARVFLAMTCARLGETAEARVALEHARAQSGEGAGDRARLLAEAEAVLAAAGE